MKAFRTGPWMIASCMPRNCSTRDQTRGLWLAERRVHILRGMNNCYFRPELGLYIDETIQISCLKQVNSGSELRKCPGGSKIAPLGKDIIILNIRASLCRCYCKSYVLTDFIIWNEVIILLSKML